MLQLEATLSQEAAVSRSKILRAKKIADDSDMSSTRQKAADLLFKKFDADGSGSINQEAPCSH